VADDLGAPPLAGGEPGRTVFEQSRLIDRDD